MHASETVLDPSVVNALVRRQFATSLEALSVREIDVLAEMAQGYSNEEIAKHLSVSQKAVESHVTSIFRKLRTPDDKRFDRRVMAVLTYLHDYGELNPPQVAHHPR